MTEGTNNNSGAKFVRADLHIHSFGADDGSYDVTDTTLTPENIVDTAIDKGLSIISITDHNEIGNSKKAIEHSADKDILVIPGIEVSTTQGHLLIYFENFTNLRNFHGKLSISEDKERCDQGIVECLNIANQFNGIGILAHIELSSGFEKMIGRFGPQIEDIIAHKNLWGLEISNKDSFKYYTVEDFNSERKGLIGLRRERLQLPANFDFPKLMSSDAHTLDRLGVNADGNKRLTRIKVDSLSFHSFKVALLSHESRIKLEDFIPEKVPRFLGMKMEGGLLSNETVKLSSNLTCIIGGRGTGKSTLLESLRECSGNSSHSSLVDCDIWPDKITLKYEDETGQQFTLSREKNSEVINEDDPVEGINRIYVESYGQGDTAATLQHSDKNPQVLIDFLDTFVDIKSLRIEDEEIRHLLIENQSQLSKLRLEISSIPETTKKMRHLQSKVEKLKKDKVGDLVKYQTSLLREREIRKEIINELKELIETYRDILTDNSVFESFSELADEEIIVGKDHFKKVKQIISEFSEIVSDKSDELNESLNEKIEELKKEIKSWSGKEKAIQEKIDAKKLDLEKRGIPFDLGKINQLAKDLSYYRERLKKLHNKRKASIELQKERDKLVKRRIKVTDIIFYQRKSFADTVNENLKNSVDGFFVSVKYRQGKYSPQFEDTIKTLMDWRTSQVSKSSYLAYNITSLEFAEAVKNKNLSELMIIKDTDGNKVFTDEEIKRILNKATENNNFEDFESLVFNDWPSITVTKIVESETGTKKPISKKLSQLSLGQQQSILLAILLQSKSQVPLIIDQPEDNLDSEFIYKTIVSTLRKIKESRQVIIVTHNPNIAVLGDAELIIPLKSTSTKSMIINHGSIDRAETSDLCCEILEGGKQAFIRRKEIYGID